MPSRFSLALLHGRDARAYIANRGGRRRPLHTQLLPCSGAFARRRQSIRGLRALVTNRSDLGKQLAHAHARKRFKERRHLRRHLGDVAGDLVHSGRIAVPGRNNGDLVDIGQWTCERFDHFRHVGEQLVNNRRLVVLLVRLGFHVHRLGFGFAFFEDDFGFGFALLPNGGSMAFGFGHETLFFCRRQGLDPLTLDLGLLQHGRDQLLLAARDLRFLYFHLLFFLDLLNLHLLSDDLLLHDVGLYVIGLIGLRLLPLGDFEELCPLDFEIALRLGLFGQGKRLRKHAVLILLRLGYRGLPLRQCPSDGGIAISFGGSNVGLALDASNVGPAHADDVFVLIANFFNGERDHFKSHLVHVICTGRTHAT